MNKQERGDFIATSIWKWLQDREAIDLVPWVTDSSSLAHDPLKCADMRGYKRCLAELRRVIESAIRELP